MYLILGWTLIVEDYMNYTILTQVHSYVCSKKFPAQFEIIQLFLIIQL